MRTLSRQDLRKTMTNAQDQGPTSEKSGVYLNINEHFRARRTQSLGVLARSCVSPARNSLSLLVLCLILGLLAGSSSADSQQSNRTTKGSIADLLIASDSPIYVTRKDAWGMTPGTLEMTSQGSDQLRVKFLRLGRAPYIQDSQVVHDIRVTSVKQRVSANGEVVTLGRGTDAFGGKHTIRRTGSGEVRVRNFYGYGSSYSGSTTSPETQRLTHPKNAWVLSPAKK